MGINHDVIPLRWCAFTVGLEWFSNPELFLELAINREF